MRVRDIMSQDVESISPEESVQAAACKMRDLDVGPLPVCDGQRIAGMITDRDIATRAVAEGRNPETTQVRDVMTEDLVFCFEDQNIDEAARLMKDRQVRRVLVLNENKQLVGIVTLGDLATQMADESSAGETLSAISEPGFQRR
jgi:CBS domain-containing protein